MFKKSTKKQRTLRRQLDSENDSEDEDDNVSETINNLKIAQKYRERPNGVDILSLVPEDVESEEESSEEELGNLQSGGLIHVGLTSDALFSDDLGIDKFLTETHKREEDDDMMKFIEEQIAIKQNKRIEKPKESLPEPECYIDPRTLTTDEAAFNAVPSYLRSANKPPPEDMLSNQMLSGIPEIDLGIQAKIKNIEATEEAKLRLKTQKKENDTGISFVPRNMAVNFLQQNRYDSILVLDDSNSQDKEQMQKIKKKRMLSSDHKATDDYHYERFKKQFRRY